MSAGRLSALERDMGRVLEKLETHTDRLDALVPKMERLIEERTEVALLKSQVSTINTHLDAMAKTVGELKTIVENGQGAKWAVNLILSGLGMAAGAYAFWKEHLR
jgi:hypothetical protein